MHCYRLLYASQPKNRAPSRVPAAFGNFHTEGVRFRTDLNRGARLPLMHALHRFMKKCMAWTYEYSSEAGKVTFEIT